MKTLKISAVFMFSLFVLMFTANTSISQTKATADKYTKVVYSVSVHCESCKEKIGKALAYEKGVKSFSVDVEKKLVTVTFDAEKTNKETIAKVIEKLGYDVKVAAGKEGCAEAAGCPKSSTCKGHH